MMEWSTSVFNADHPKSFELYSSSMGAYWVDNKNEEVSAMAQIEFYTHYYHDGFFAISVIVALMVSYVMIICMRKGSS